MAPPKKETDAVSKRLKLIIEEQEACATCVDNNHGLPERRATHIVMEYLPWVIEQLNTANVKLQEAREELAKIIRYQPIYYNGRGDRAGDMDIWLSNLLAKLEE